MKELIVIAVLVFPTAVTVWCLNIWLRRKHALATETFDKKYPPISDKEFVRRCGPGTDSTVALKVRQIIAEQLAIPARQIYPEQRLIDDLGVD